MRAVVDLVGWTLIEFTWQGAVIGAVAAAVLRMLSRRSSQARYLTACVALLAMLIAPAITAVAISHGGIRRVGEAVAADVPLVLSRSDHAIEPAPARVTAGAPLSSSDRDLLLPLVLAWAVGVSVSLLRLSTAWWHVRRLHRASLCAAASALQPIADRLARRIGLSYVVHVVDSIHVATPSVVGSLRPVILLPVAALAALTPAQVEAILAHELAHICRRDYLVNVLQSIAEALLFFHPAVWWLSGRIRAEREHCCDDIAVAVSGDALDYARALAHLATWQNGAAAPLAAAAAGGSLLERIERLVGDRRHDAQPSAYAVTLPVVMALLIAVGGGLQPSTSGAHGSTPRLLRAAMPGSGAVTTVASFRLAPPPPAPPPAPLPGLQADLAFQPTDHFDVYFPQQLRGRIDVIVRASEEAYSHVSADLRHDLSSRPVLVLFATRAELERAPSLVRFGATASAPRILIAADVATSRLAGTLRHEIAHAFAFDILPGGTAPRWLQEGLAEYERGDVDATSLTTLRTLAARNALPAVTRIDTIAFPSNPRLDDALGAQVLEFIASRWGWDGIRRLLLATRGSNGARSDAFVTTFGMSADAFDRAFASYVESAPQVAAAREATAVIRVLRHDSGAAEAARAFDAVIRPNTTDSVQSRLTADPGGRISGRNVTLKMLIRQAYRVTEQEIDGGPPWLDSLRFDVDAKANGDMSLAQLQAVLASLLVDRFGLVVHREARERAIFSLVNARSDGNTAAGLRSATVDCAALLFANRARVAPARDGAVGEPPSCGIRFTPGMVVARGTPLDRLAATLSRLVGRLVVDRTNLTGNFDFDLAWAPAVPGAGSSSIDVAASRAAGDSVFTAVQEQLGLKLEPTRGAVDVLVIDAAARPSWN